MTNTTLIQHTHNWIVIGSNFTKADTVIRSSFAITHSKMADVYARANSLGLKDFFVLSTCNRTEFYGSASIQIMKELVMDQLHVSAGQLENLFYIHTGYDAVRHLFKVVTGLNSQIIGDYEIVGQVKKAVQHAREIGLVQTLTDRITSYAFQASKEVKKKTNLSQGKYSVSFAAAELILDYHTHQAVDNILIVGTGEIGQAMARNLKEYFPKSKLTVTNRTHEHALPLADELKLNVLPFETFVDNIDQFDVVIASVESNQYLISPNHIGNSRCLLLDLSIPQVIDPEIKTNPNLTLYTVDEISAFHNELMKKRHLEIPKAEQILDDYINRFREWHATAQYSSVLLGYKEKLGRAMANAETVPITKIEKGFSGLMRQIRTEGYCGCFVINTVNELLTQEK